jgi:hypothetical protein
MYEAPMEIEQPSLTSNGYSISKASSLVRNKGLIIAMATHFKLTKKRSEEKCRGKKIKQKRERKKGKKCLKARLQSDESESCKPRFLKRNP